MITNGSGKFDRSDNPEQHAAAIFELASKLEGAQDKIRAIESLSGEQSRAAFIEFARDYFDAFYALSSDIRTNQNMTTLGATNVAITKTSDQEPTAVSIFVESQGNTTNFQLPDPDLLESNNSEWSGGSLPVGSSSIMFDGMEDPLVLHFDLVRKPNPASYANFAASIAFAAEVIVAANTEEVAS